jgi:transcriptional regulator with XRE-family HTH domain
MPTPIRNKLRRPARVYLQEWIEYRGLTAEQLAGRLETSKSVVSKLMTGKQRYNQDWLEAIAYALDCEVQQLYRPPTAPTANELLSMMTPEARETAMNVLVDLSRLRTGTDD